jgi:hypothetical protein
VMNRFARPNGRNRSENRLPVRLAALEFYV